jgi:hypothetical protein
METTHHALFPPSLDDLACVLGPALQRNYTTSSVTVVTCPDLRKKPFHLATEGLSGDECIADVGGQPNLFPRPRLECTYSLLDIAKTMSMDPKRGSLIGAGAGPFHHIGQNTELAPNLSWSNGFDSISNKTHVAKIDTITSRVSVEKSSTTDCALMANLFGSSGLPGPVLKITARGRKGSQKSFTECIRLALSEAYGDTRPVSLGGAFVVKAGKTHYHIMPDFPSEDKLPFKDGKAVEDWLTFHDLEAPMVCLSVLHSADPGELGLRMEHTHCFSAEGKDAGGHYHGDVDGEEEEVEYEGYFNAAKMVHRVDRPEVMQERD